MLYLLASCIHTSDFRHCGQTELISFPQWVWLWCSFHICELALWPKGLLAEVGCYPMQTAAQAIGAAYEKHKHKGGWALWESPQTSTKRTISCTEDIIWGTAVIKLRGENKEGCFRLCLWATDKPCKNMGSRVLLNRQNRMINCVPLTFS